MPLRVLWLREARNSSKLPGRRSAARPRRDQRLVAEEAAERGERGSELGAERERREGHDIDLAALERALDDAGEGRGRAGVGASDPAVDDLEQPARSARRRRGSRARSAAGASRSAGEPADRGVALVDDGGERADHAGRVRRRVMKKAIHGLLALPRQLVPGRPEPLELLEGARDLDPELGRAHLDGLEHEADLRAEVSRFVGAVGGIVFGIETSTRTGVCATGTAITLGLPFGTTMVDVACRRARAAARRSCRCGPSRRRPSPCPAG